MPHALFPERAGPGHLHVRTVSLPAPASSGPTSSGPTASDEGVDSPPPVPGPVELPRPDGGTARALARSSSVATLPTTPPAASDRSGLERLDAAVVPRLQSGAHAAARTAGAPLRSISRAEDAVAGGLVRWWVRHRQLVLLAATVLAVLGSAVHFARYPEVRQAEADRRAAAERQTVSEPGVPSGSPGALAGGAQATGPVIGADVSSYIEERHEDLAELPAGERRLAVVSFGEYLSAAEALAGVPEGATIHAAQLRIPAEGEEPFQTEVVGNDLLGSVERALADPLAEFAREEADLEELIPTVTDPAFRQDYEARLAELRAIRNLINSGAGTVFAVVIEAEVGALQDLIDDAVRLVDVAPGETQFDRSGFFGLRPEDRETVTYGVPI